MKLFLDKLVERQNLTESEARALLDAMTDPELDQVRASAALTALRVKGETADEVRGFALRLRELAIRPETPENAPAVDIVGDRWRRVGQSESLHWCSASRRCSRCPGD